MNIEGLKLPSKYLWTSCDKSSGHFRLPLNLVCLLGGPYTSLTLMSALKAENFCKPLDLKLTLSQDQYLYYVSLLTSTQNSSKVYVNVRNWRQAPSNSVWYRSESTVHSLECLWLKQLSEISERMYRMRKFLLQFKFFHINTQFSLLFHMVF